MSYAQAGEALQLADIWLRGIRVLLVISFLQVCGCGSDSSRHRACEILDLIRRESFGESDDVLFVETLLPVNAYDVSAITAIDGPSGLPLVYHDLGRANRDARWHIKCERQKYIGRIDEGCRETLLFPVAETESNRVWVSHLIWQSDRTVAVVARCTNCRTFSITKLYVLSRDQSWKIDETVVLYFV